MLATPHAVMGSPRPRSATRPLPAFSDSFVPSRPGRSVVRPGAWRRLARLVRAVLGGPSRARRRRRQDQRLRVLRRVAGRPGLPVEIREFLQGGVERLGRLSARLQSLGVADDLLLAWREGVLTPLEREATRARRQERVRARLRGPLPTTVVEERLLARAATGPEGPEVARERAGLLAELDRLLAEVSNFEGAGA